MLFFLYEKGEREKEGLNIMIRHNFIFCFSSVRVDEIRYEKISPQLDAATLNDSSELKFTILPNTDFFTRYI
jgi:hypothetical protein